MSRFPAWCVYFDAPGLTLDGHAYDGFFAMLDEAKSFRHLCLYFLSEEKEYFMQPIRLGGWGIREGFLSILKSSRYAGQLAAREFPEIEPAIHAALNLILYAFSQGHMHGTTANTPAAKKTRKGWRLFPPAKPSIHVLGEELGEKLRRAAASFEAARRSGPCPHIRRGHWHSYRTGAGRRIIDLKWLAPFPVALAETA